MISFVWSEDQKHQIGYKGHLPWRLPADLAHFKKVTMGHPMVMGKKTFDSFPGLLPGRKHVVLTHDTTLKEKYKDNSQVKIQTIWKAPRSRCPPRERSGQEASGSL